MPQGFHTNALLRSWSPRRGECCSRARQPRQERKERQALVLLHPRLDSTWVSGQVGDVSTRGAQQVRKSFLLEFFRVRVQHFPRSLLLLLLGENEPACYQRYARADVAGALRRPRSPWIALDRPGAPWSAAVSQRASCVPVVCP